MSSIYGVFHRDGRPVGREEAERFAASFEWWKPDASDFVVEGSVTLGQATLWNTPESHHEHLPLRQGELILVADARIDNREELAKELDLPDKPIEHIGDGEFILAAYRKWGEACPEKLLGDYAFAIWDEAKRELFCARDFIGVRPLYFYADERIFVFGSEIEGLVKHPAVPRKIRETSVAKYLAGGRLKDDRYTFFENIFKLESGHTLRIDNTQKRFRQYWNIRKIQPMELQSKEAYVEYLQELLVDAVRVRMRTSYGVSAHLSGGLDSSPVAVLAARELRRRSAEPLHVYSWHLPPGEGDDPEHFEWRYPDEVAKQEGMVLHWGSVSLERVYQEMTNTNICFEKGQHFWHEFFIRDELKMRNVRTMFSGWGGDEFITNHAYPYYCELFWKGKWKQLFNTMKKRELHGLKSWLKFIYKRIIVPSMPSMIYCYMPFIHCDNPDITGVQPSFIHAVNQEWKKLNQIFNYDTSSHNLMELYRAWDNAHVQTRLVTWSQGGKPYHLEYVFPLLDRRIVELSLSLPIEYMHGEGRDRYIYRMAVKDLLPEDVLWQKGKSEKNFFKQTDKLSSDFMKIYRERNQKLENNYIKIDPYRSNTEERKYIRLLPLLQL